MSDPRAGLILAAEDVTNAAFASANRNINTLASNANNASTRAASGFKGFASSITSVRGALASLGIVLSGRALFSWMSRAVDATTAVGQQREEVLRAKSAFAEFRAASDALAESLAVRVEPAIRLVTKALDDFRRNRDGPTVLDTFNEKLTRAKQDLETLPLEIARMEAFRGTGGEGAQALAALEQRLQTAKELAGVLGAAQEAGKLEEIKVTARALPENEIGLMLERQRQKEREAARVEREAAQEEVLRAEEAFHNARLEREAEDAEKAERRRELLAQQVEDVRFFTLSELEQEADVYARRQAMLDAALEQKLISEQRHAEISTELARQTERAIADIRQREAQRERQLQLSKLAATANLFSGLAAIAAAGGEKSKKNFELSKKLAIAEAIVNTYAAVTYALRNPPGPPFSFVQAAAAAAMGFAQVKAIQSTSWSGGGASVGGFGGDGGGVSATLPNERMAGLLSGEGSGGRNQTIVNVNITTGVIGSVDPQAARLIADAVRHEVETNDVVIITRESRNGLTIRGDGVENE